MSGQHRLAGKPIQLCNHEANKLVRHIVISDALHKLFNLFIHKAQNTIHPGLFWTEDLVLKLPEMDFSQVLVHFFCQMYLFPLCINLKTA